MKSCQNPKTTEGGEPTTGKRKIITVSIIFVISTTGSIFLSTWLHLSLKQSFIGADQLKINACLASLASDRQHLSLFAILLPAIIGACVALYMNERNKEDYASEIRTITEKIQTPVSVGQGQHGTAKWLDKKEYPKLFYAVDLNPGNKQKAKLIQQGYDDLKNKEGSEANISENEPESTPDSHSPDKPSPDKKLLPHKSAPAFEIFERGGLPVGYQKTNGTERIYVLDDDMHTCTIGATRSGKTRSLVLQSIVVQALSGESMVNSDPKGGATRSQLKRLGVEPNKSRLKGAA